MPRMGAVVALEARTAATQRGRAAPTVAVREVQVKFVGHGAPSWSTTEEEGYNWNRECFLNGGKDHEPSCAG